MPVCCRCNGSGRCRNCSYARSGNNCVDCLLLRRQRCENSCGDQQQGAPENVSAEIVSQTQRTCGAGSTEAKSGEAAMPSVSEENVEPSLPPFAPACPPDGACAWGSCDGPTMNAKITDCYNEVIHWMRNVFRVPSGRAGKAFVCELARLFQGFNLLRRPELSPTPLPLLQTYHTCCSKSHM